MTEDGREKIDGLIRLRLYEGTRGLAPLSIIGQALDYSPQTTGIPGDGACFCCFVEPPHGHFSKH